MRASFVAVMVVVATLVVAAGEAVRGAHIVTSHAAVLRGSREVPPVPTDHRGVAVFQYVTKKDKERELDKNTMLYYIFHNAPGATAAHLHAGAVGVNTPEPLLDANLGTGATHADGMWADFDRDNFNLVNDAETYVNVHTAANPGGELRGQMECSSEWHAAVMTGAGQVPPVATTALGVVLATFDLLRDDIDIEVWHNISNPLAAHIHIADDDGSLGGVAFDLSDGGNTSLTEMPIRHTFHLTLDQRQAFFDGRMYVNVHTAAHTDGEILGFIHTLTCLDKSDFAKSSGGPDGSSIAAGILIPLVLIGIVFAFFKFNPAAKEKCTKCMGA